MTEPRLLIPYFREAPKFLLQQRRVFIAGGAVLDLEKATDVDVFVLNCKEFPALDLIRGHFHLGNQQSTSKSSGGKKRTLIYTKHDMKPINVICSDSRSITELLEGFDLSTSRWAVSVEGKLINVPTSIKPGDPIVVHYVTYKTPERIRKYGERFGPHRTTGEWVNNSGKDLFDEII